jgi:addiction module HigA family antidote
MATNLQYGYYPTHPGEILKEEFEYRKLSQKEFAKATGIPYTMLNDILNAKRPVSADFALTIEATLGIEAELLVNMQTRYNMQMARRDQTKIKRWDELKKACAALW